MGTTNKSSAPTAFQMALTSVLAVALLQVLYRACLEAYKIRLVAIEEYGRVIHEFDPYFNYRATEYLYANGWKKFRTWFDYKVWYPLGRPVGTTIYPGMQVTSVAIKEYILPKWSINDICCFVPTWFGVLATLAVAWLTYECVASQPTRSLAQNIPVVRDVYNIIVVKLVQALLKLLKTVTGSTWGLSPQRPSALTPLACAVAAACIMSIVPAHLMRSVGGGYDNESIAMTAMVLVFACWCRALQETKYPIVTAIWGALTGLAYFNMVAAWGGYVFVLNLVAVHAAVLVLLGRFSRKLWMAYSMFYVVGTTLAIQVPVVGWVPLKSLEQVGALLAFGGLQLLQLSEYLIARRGKLSQIQRWRLRLTVFLAAGAVGGVVVAALAPSGYFGPVSSRVRGLFVKHTKTGNPLVDSVAEHQAASPQAYFQYLNNVVYLAPVGFALTALFYVTDSSTFLLVYGMAAYYFSHRMVRLILLTAPIASCFGGIVIGRVVVWMVGALVDPVSDLSMLFAEDDAAHAGDTKVILSPKTKSNGKAKSAAPAVETPHKGSDPLWVKGVRLVVSAMLIKNFIPHAKDFWNYAHQMSKAMSHPSIIMKGTTQDGRPVTVDDYRQAYWWLRDNTPEDARVMAWWDYGYQITGISERTTMADGNTWNHEHIALLGRTLTASEKEAHRIARHLADYVLVWSGGGGDDLAKSPHLRRIANSVFRGLCAEPTCRDFGFYVS